MNIELHSQQLVKAIQDHTAEFILDNVSKGLTWDHQPVIEAAMLIGASIALGLEMDSDPIDPACQCDACGYVHNPNEACVQEPDCPPDNMDGDHASGLASAGFGCDEDYGGGTHDWEEWQGDSDGSVGCD